MERYIFIHGSASGQSLLPFDVESSKLCNEIGNWYFEGRESRIKGTASSRPMFVELYKGTDGKRYCLYSFVQNECFGPAPDPRPGQYFAVTIALLESYCIHPSSIYRILVNAYDQLIRNKIIADKVVIGNKNYCNVYNIGQFDQKKDVLIDFQRKILSFFDKSCLQWCTSLPENVSFPLPWNGKATTKMIQNRVERLAWDGETIHLSECDSIASAEKLIKDGRIYISDKAPRATEYIQQLQEEKKQLETRNKVLQEKVDNPAPNLKDIREIASLKSENEKIRNEANRVNSEKNRLQKENQDLMTTFDGLSQLINKYQKTTGNQFGRIDDQMTKEGLMSNGWKRWVKVICLLLILVFTLIGLVLNVLFFRNLSSSIDETNSQIKRIDSVVQKKSFSGRHQEKSYETITMEQIGDDQQNQVAETTVGAIATEETPIKETKSTIPDYGLTITNEHGESIKSVQPGQIIRAYVKFPESGLDWKFDGVEKTDPNDVNPVLLKVVLKKGRIAIGYGDPNDRNKRQRKSFTVQQ